MAITRLLTSTLIAALSSAMLTPTTAQAEPHEVTFQTVALTGGAVLGRTGDEVYENFSMPAIADSGQVIFGGFFSGTGVSSLNDTGAWTWTPSSSTWFAQEGDIALGANETFGSLNNSAYWITDNGEVLMFNRLGPSASGTILFGPIDGTLSPVIREGMTSPIGIDYLSVSANGMSSNGHISMSAHLDIHSGSDNMLLSGTSDDFHVVAYTRGSIPAIPGDWVYGGFARNSINQAGTLIFSAGISGPAINQFNDTAIFLANGSDPILVAREGNPIPNLSGATFGSLGQMPGINASGHYLFESSISNLPGTRYGIWVGQNGSANARVLEGDEATGLGQFVDFGGPFRRPLINDQNTIAFQVELKGLGVVANNNDSLWINSTTMGNHLVAREGDIIAETGGASISTFENFDLNALNYVAFRAALTDGTHGLFVYDPNEDEYIKIIRIGELFEVAEGDFRVVQSIVYGDSSISTSGSGGSDGRRMGFNNHNQLTFRARFTDGTQGIFVANVPEPSSAVIFALTTLMLGRRKR